MYLSENKKEAKEWFNALGRSTPFGGTKFGLIRSISTSGEKVNAKFSLKAYSDTEKKQHVADAKVLPQVSELGKFRYQLKSAPELEQEIRELKRERAALENRNRVLTERVEKWKGELKRTETPRLHAYRTTKQLKSTGRSAKIGTKDGDRMTGGIVEIDLHGKNEYQARVTIDAALRRARAGTYRLRIIHGYHNGTALRDMVRKEYPGRVLRVVPLDQGRTDLVLREF